MGYKLQSSFEWLMIYEDEVIQPIPLNYVLNERQKKDTSVKMA